MDGHMEQKFEIVKLSRVQVDENQPRKYFDTVKLRALLKSIEKEGIISPLIVEKVGDNFLLIDGERRWRAAIELNLKEVPVIIESLSTKAERRARQFTVQEQHEAWTPAEKANALIELSDEVGLSLYETCKLLNVAPGDIHRYVAFSQMVDKEGFLKSRVPVDYAVAIQSLRNSVKRIYENDLKKEFTRNDEKKLEHRIIKSVMDGHVTKRTEIVRLKDAFTKNPKLIEVYLESSKETPTSLYLKAEAQGATALRNMTIQANYVSSWAERFLQNRDVKITPQQIASYKKAQRLLGQVIDLAE